MHPITRPLNDDELRAAPPHIRAWYLRVVTLMHFHGATWELAVAAVEDADAQQNIHASSDQLVTSQRTQP